MVFFRQPIGMRRGMVFFRQPIGMSTDEWILDCQRQYQVKLSNAANIAAIERGTSPDVELAQFKERIETNLRAELPTVLKDW